MDSSNKNKIATGRRGECIAEDYLRKKGYKVIKRNWRTRWGEIDLVAFHKNSLRFIEVRTRKGEQYGSPEESINQTKRNKMIRNAQAYVSLSDYTNDYFLECVCVVLDNNDRVLRIGHYEELC